MRNKDLQDVLEYLHKLENNSSEEFMIDAYEAVKPDIDTLLYKACSSVQDNVLDWAVDNLDSNHIQRVIDENADDLEETILQNIIFKGGVLTYTDKMFVNFIEKLIYNKSNFQIPDMDDLTALLANRRLI